jgi:hypothetical protein
MDRLRHGRQDIGHLVNPAALRPGLGEDLTQRCPQPKRPVADRDHWGAHPAPAQVAQHLSPGVSGLPVAVGHRDQLLGAVQAGTHDHQAAQPLLGQANVEVHAVRPDVDVVAVNQAASHERFPLGLPLGGQAGHHRGRQASGRAEERFQCGHEVAGGQAVQIQQWQDLADLGLLRHQVAGSRS